MSTVRITVDLPKRKHRKLKTTAAQLGVSMKTVIELSLDELYKSEDFNKKTLSAIRDAERGENITSYDSIEDAFKDLGI